MTDVPPVTALLRTRQAAEVSALDRLMPVVYDAVAYLAGRRNLGARPADAGLRRRRLAMPRTHGERRRHRWSLTELVSETLLTGHVEIPE